jgi:hypothetical protein
MGEGGGLMECLTCGKDTELYRIDDMDVCGQCGELTSLSTSTTSLVGKVVKWIIMGFLLLVAVSFVLPYMYG